MNSLQRRMSYATVLLLLCCAFVLASLLTNAFKKTLIASEQNRLQGVVYTVLSLLDVLDAQEVWLDDALLSESLQGAQVSISDARGHVIWPVQSASSVQVPDVGQWTFATAEKGKRGFSLAYGFAWGLETAVQEYRFGVLVRDPGHWFVKQMRHFRKKLWLWLASGCLGLMVLQMLMLRWCFVPLTTVAKEIADIELGRKQGFAQKYPTEIEPLTARINSLLKHERAQQSRFRQALDDLAHALKTPVAALKAMLDVGQEVEDFSAQAKGQLKRMQSMIDYQLQKASTLGRSPFTQPIALKPIVEAVVASLEKVYHQKAIAFTVQVDTATMIKMDEGDAYEVLGNVIENAAKYGSSKVKIGFASGSCVVEDDGPGIDASQVALAIKRGARLDERVEGSGIGLAVAHDIVSVYGGGLHFSSSDLGGVKVDIAFG